MKIQRVISFFRRISISLLIGFYLILLPNVSLHANPIPLSIQVVQTTLVSDRNLSNVSLISGVYLMVLLGIGYVINRYFNLRKTKEEDTL